MIEGLWVGVTQRRGGKGVAVWSKRTGLPRRGRGGVGTWNGAVGMGGCEKRPLWLP